MTDTIISFETARLAKKKGFNWKVRYSYGHAINLHIAYPNDDFSISCDFNSPNIGRNWKHLYSAPTQSLLQKWLRDGHEIYISINTTTSYRTNGSTDIDDHEYIPVHQYKIIKNIDNWKYEVVEYSDEYEDYKECLDDALIDGLKLIKNDNTTDS